MKYNTYLSVLFIFSFLVGTSQEILTKNDAVSLALNNNYGILIAKNNLKIAENNTSVLNTGYLPKIAVSSGAGYSNTTSELTNQLGVETNTDNAESKSLTASIGLNYLLFDGFGRAFNYKKLKESFNFTELQARSIIENTITDVFYSYYDVAQLTEDTLNISESLKISKQRLKRVQYAFEYGQNTKLQVLNAEVDVNNDSIRYINTQRLLANSKRDLNLLLGRAITTDFKVETKIEFHQLFNLETLLEKAKAANVDIQKINSSIKLNNLDIQMNKSDLLPTLNLSSSYGLQKLDNDQTFTYADQLSKGLNANISLNWNLFDGGTTKNRIQNSKIIADNLSIQEVQLNNSLERSMANALEVYTNSLIILTAEEKNVETNKRNFSRTEEQFKLGQITTIEFRQAQINLLNAQSNLNQSKFDAKNAELLILQLSGELLNTEF
ncbi:MAG: TolC family protein [Lutibacter sp.]|nr:TolC family protein [Lutibacter sp.]MBP9601373.1 TolC family protein [Lutibacter sp.]